MKTYLLAKIFSILSNLHLITNTLNHFIINNLTLNAWDLKVLLNPGKVDLYRKNTLGLKDLRLAVMDKKDVYYCTSRKYSLELIGLSSINKVTLV